MFQGGKSALCRKVGGVGLVPWLPLQYPEDLDESSIVLGLPLHSFHSRRTLGGWIWKCFFCWRREADCYISWPLLLVDQYPTRIHGVVSRQRRHHRALYAEPLRLLTRLRLVIHWLPKPRVATRRDLLGCCKSLVLQCKRLHRYPFLIAREGCQSLVSALTSASGILK